LLRFRVRFWVGKRLLLISIVLFFVACRAPIVGLLLAGFTLEHLGTILIVIGMLAFAHWRARRSGRPF
jgi:hypothetical protein